MLRERVQEWMAEKWAEGHAEGQVELMRRMAARKFGGETAERLVERLKPVHDPSGWPRSTSGSSSAQAVKNCSIAWNGRTFSCRTDRNPSGNRPDRYADSAASLTSRTFEPFAWRPTTASRSDWMRTARRTWTSRAITDD